MKQLGSIKNQFFYVILGFTQSHSGELGDIDRFVQLLPGTYKGDKPVNITGIDKIQLKCDCVQGIIFNGIPEPFFYSFALSSPPGRKVYKEPRIKLSER